MSYSTVYDVRVRYSVDNRAGRSGTQGLTNDVRALGAEARRTTGVFGRLGVAVTAAFGARAAGKALIGFNSKVEDTKNQIAAMLALVRKTDVVDQLKVADRIYGNLQKRAAALPGTTQEYVTMASKLTRVIVDAGGSTKDLEDLTVSAVVAAKGLGEQWDVAARDIEQALMGRYNTTDPFLSKLLPMIGYAGEEGRDKWRGLTKDKRFEEMKRALTQKQITQAAALQGASFSGVLSTLQDTLEQTLGKVGKPLFAAIGNEIRDWNKWLAANGAAVDSMAKSLGEHLVTGFRFVKDVLGFMVSHADLLIMVGKVWAAVKIGGMLQGGANLLGNMINGSAPGGGGGMRGLLGFFRGASDKFNKDTGEYEFTPAGRGRRAIGGLKGLAENAGLLGSSAAVGYAIGNMLGLDDVGKNLGHSLAVMTGRIDPTTLAFEKLQRESARLEQAMRAAAAAHPNAPSALRNLAGASMDYKQQANLVADFLRAQKAAEGGGMGAMTELAQRRLALEAAGISESDFQKFGGAQGFVTSMQASATQMDVRAGGAGMATFAAMQLGMTKLTEYQRKSLETEQAQEEISRYMVQQLASGKLINPDTVMEILRRNTSDPEGKHKNIADKPKVNVTIQRIEVQSDDPDRMAFGMIESFRDAAKNPSSALASLREG